MTQMFQALECPQMDGLRDGQTDGQMDFRDQMDCNNGYDILLLDFIRVMDMLLLLL